MDLCRSMSSSSRIFSFGLGHSPSRTLVKGLARATNGHFVFIPPNASVDIYVAEQLIKALQPCITNVQVKWNQTGIQTAPKKVPPVYANDRLIFYGLLESSDSSQFQHDITVSLYKTDNSILLGEAKVDRIPSTVEDQTLSHLAAKALIHELQHEKSEEQNKGSLQARFQQQQDEQSLPVAATEKQLDKRQQLIIDLSLKYGILSPYTSYVGIEKRLNIDNNGMILREVPIEISADDKHFFARPQGRNQTHFSSIAYDDSIDDNLQLISSGLGNLRNIELNMWDTIAHQNVQIDRIRDRAELYKKKVKITNGRAKQLLSLERDSSIGVNKSFSTLSQWPTLEQDIVRHLIDLQKFDGLWSLSDEQIKKLTEKPLSSYRSQYTSDHQIISSALVLIILEQERFKPHKTLWQACFEKTKRRLTQLLGGNDKMELVLQELREQILNHSAEEIKTKTMTTMTSRGNSFTKFFKTIFK
ncbi:unnamed protein product [Rotaria sp. Silwood2]|nr:unnamed protein product [Rotaria sp. Silwood2]CAF3074019.1 unnamed protein product [Rotaria sp. Silwood2]CAF3444103.1 unnamed protein product [Rotaria sp. Silwood2]CAF4441441.1 unnamed protein product [Rotaria sp. Silwood2]CAF4505586.1 unnamed protein product [Rotaria sp. Silwood2]